MVQLVCSQNNAGIPGCKGWPNGLLTDLSAQEELESPRDLINLSQILTRVWSWTNTESYNARVAISPRIFGGATARWDKVHWTESPLQQILTA